MADIQPRTGRTKPATVGNLTQALIEFQRIVAPIHKDAKGAHARYATMQAVLAAVQPALIEAGLAVTQTFDGAQLITTLRHGSSDETVSSSVPLVIGSGRNPLHDWGGAVTYQRRYALLAILNLAAGMEDDDGARMQRASPSVSNDDFI